MQPGAGAGASGSACACRIVLVDLYWTRDKDPRVPLGHASLLAALRRYPQIEAISVVAPVNPTLTVKRIADEILRHTAGLPRDAVDIGIGAYIWNERVLKRLLPRLREHFGGRIILGGPQVSYVESGLERLYPEADVFIRGFAESSLTAAVRSSTPVPIPGVHYAGGLDAGTQSSAVLGDMPSPLLEGLIGLEGQGFLRWETRRGCQFKCAFCQHRQRDARSNGASFPRERVMEEIDLICRAGVKEVAVLDPVFNSNEEPGHAERVLARFAANGYRGRLALQCRAELVTQAFLDAAQELDVCLEFGLQTIHKDEQLAIGRTNSMDRVALVLDEVRRRGIDHEVSLIFGLPQQTLASFRESVRWCLERHVPVIKAFPLLLLRGTKLDLERARWQLVVEDEAMPQVVASSTFSRAEWRAMLAISQQLSETEGRHPGLDALVAASSVATPDQTRFQPEFEGDAV
jgi:hypothetical protein